MTIDDSPPDSTSTAPDPLTTPTPVTDEPMPPAVTDDDVVVRLERGHDSPTIKQVAAVLAHPPTGRTLRHMFAWDAHEQLLYEAELGRVDEAPVFYNERHIAEWRPGGKVFVAPLEEEMPFELYAETVGFDEPTYRLGVGWETHTNDGHKSPDA